jgi:TPR repeat protein
MLQNFLKGGLLLCLLSFTLVAGAADFASVKRAAETGDAKAQYELSLMYRGGKGVPKNELESVNWLIKSEEGGYAPAKHDVGLLMYEEKEYKRAEKFFSAAAEKGFAKSQFMLGLMYDTGQGVPKNAVKAVHWYKKAAEQGRADAQWMLGTMYADGNGVAKNSMEAVKWYEKSAVQGDVNGQVKLGLMYATGDGVTKNYEEAAKWLSKAAAQGHEAAREWMSSYSSYLSSSFSYRNLTQIGVVGGRPGYAATCSNGELAGAYYNASGGSVICYTNKRGTILEPSGSIETCLMRVCTQ